MIYRRKKYHYNPLTLTYEEIKTYRKRRIRYVMLFLLIASGISLASGYWLTRMVGSQESRVLEKQLEVLNREMKHLFNKGRKLSTSITLHLFKHDNYYRSILQLDTLPYSHHLAGSGGSAALNGIAMQDDLPYQVENMINKLNSQVEIQAGSLETLYAKALEHSSLQTHLPAIQPVASEDLIMISSDFGIRSDPFFFVERIHSGLDFVASLGRKVFATGDGTVTFVKYSRTGYGNEIVLDHRFGFGSRYAHLDVISVKEGEVVKRGQIIGTVGESGRATGPHLHYEVLYKSRPVNPSYYFDTNLTNEEFSEIIANSSK